MAGSFGYKFIFATVVFYFFLATLLVNGGSAFLTADIVTSSCINGTTTHWFPVTNLTDDYLQNLANATLIKINMIAMNPSQIWLVYQWYNSTWFTPVTYDIYKQGYNPLNSTNIYNIRYDAITYVYITNQTTIGVCSNEIDAGNFIDFIWQNPLSSLAILSWLSLALLVTNIYIITTSLIP